MNEQSIGAEDGIVLYKLDKHLTLWQMYIFGIENAEDKLSPLDFKQSFIQVMKNAKTIDIPSINYHLWRPCNMKCKFCFATFEDSREYLPKGHLSKEDSLELIDQIIDGGLSKITFAGGEPTLCKWLPDLIERAKLGGLTTMIVTNGTFLTNDYLDRLKGKLDWITLSIDSLNPATNKQLGRHSRKEVPEETYYRHLISRIREKGFKLKINTVVSRLNYTESLANFIMWAKPERWKIFQVLPIQGQNDEHIADLKIGHDQFETFISNHSYVSEKGIVIVPETNDDMTATYLMVDPAGRFYDNANGEHRYSEPILDIGIKKAYSQVHVDYTKFRNRNGIYDWVV